MRFLSLENQISESGSQNVCVELKNYLHLEYIIRVPNRNPNNAWLVKVSPKSVSLRLLNALLPHYYRPFLLLFINSANTYGLLLSTFCLCEVFSSSPFLSSVICFSFQMNKSFMKTDYKPGLLVGISVLVNAVYVTACNSTSLGLRQNIHFIFCFSLSQVTKNKISEGRNISSLLT